MTSMPLNPEALPLYWQSVVQTMSEGLFIVDTGGVVVYMNPAAERITGYAASEVVGKSCQVLESDSCRRCRIQRQQGGEGGFCELFRGGAVSGQRCAVRKKDGRLVHLIKNASVLMDSHGRVIGGVETLTDISEMLDKDRQISGLKRQLSKDYGFGGLIGQSAAMRSVFALLEAAAESPAPVVILGQSGTGKELAAAAIHRRSRRKAGPFIKVNCAALNPDLLESELFGHVKGAFTGAEKDREGRFEAARGGSILLDEIGDLPQEVQVKLLRVLQEGEIERVGCNQTRKVDARIISATHQDLGRLMELGSFRQDLFYRINVIPITLPPLKDRPEDIPLLAQAFTERAALRTGKAISGFAPPALAVLAAHDWPGNVRELINAVEYAFVTCPQGYVEPHHLPPALLAASGSAGSVAQTFCEPFDAVFKSGREREQRAQIMAALKQTGGRKARAAALLGISRVTLWKRMKRLGLTA